MELLVAVSIFAVIAVSLYSIFSGGIQIWKRQEKGFVYNHTVRLVFDTMARELRNAINYSQAPQAATAETQAEMKLLKFTGEEKKLTFITLAGTEIEKVDYIFEETAQDKGQLRKKTVFQKDGFKEEKQKDSILIQGLEGLSFEYVYKAPAGEDTLIWKDSWGKDIQTAAPAIPAGVRITLSFPSAGEQPAEIFTKTVFIPTGSIETYNESGG